MSKNSGLHGHSTVVGGEQYIIFASDLPTDETLKVLDGYNVPYKKLKGSYKGELEDSFIVNEKVFMLGKFPHHLIQKQESVLHLGVADARDKRPATLLYNDLIGDAKVEKLGLFHSVPEEQAKEQDAWTYDPLQDQYFIAA